MQNVHVCEMKRQLWNGSNPSCLHCAGEYCIHDLKLENTVHYVLQHLVADIMLALQSATDSAY